MYVRSAAGVVCLALAIAATGFAENRATYGIREGVRPVVFNQATPRMMEAPTEADPDAAPSHEMPCNNCGACSYGCYPPGSVFVELKNFIGDGMMTGLEHLGKAKVKAQKYLGPRPNRCALKCDLQLHIPLCYLSLSPHRCAEGQKAEPSSRGTSRTNGGSIRSWTTRQRRSKSDRKGASGLWWIPPRRCCRRRQIRRQADRRSAPACIAARNRLRQASPVNWISQTPLNVPASATSPVLEREKVASQQVEQPRFESSAVQPTVFSSSSNASTGWPRRTSTLRFVDSEKK